MIEFPERHECEKSIVSQAKADSRQMSEWIKGHGMEHEVNMSIMITYYKFMGSITHPVRTPSGMINKYLSFNEDGSARLASFLSTRLGVSYYTKRGKAFINGGGRDIEVYCSTPLIRLTFMIQNKKSGHKEYHFSSQTEGIDPAVIISDVHGFLLGRKVW